jgi:hypothetical protein
LHSWRPHWSPHGASARQAQGAPEDKRVFFTFSGPVAVPGVTLPAGKYLFRLPTTIASGERHVMQGTERGRKTFVRHVLWHQRQQG